MVLRIHRVHAVKHLLITIILIHRTIIRPLLVSGFGLQQTSVIPGRMKSDYPPSSNIPYHTFHNSFQSSLKLSTKAGANVEEHEYEHEYKHENKEHSDKCRPVPAEESSGEPKIDKSPKKLHTMTVCMVPESRHENVWQAITRARTELRDPGLYRWPPHANILYPFFDIQPKEEKVHVSEAEIENGESSLFSQNFEEEKLHLLAEAVKRCDPFRISLDSFGTFGGQSRGVLFLYPRSFIVSDYSNDIINESSHAKDEDDDENSDKQEKEPEEPLIQLQSVLQEFLPECNDQKKNGKYTPHITLSHFASLQDALEGQVKLETWWEPLEYDVKEIYVLKRVGDDGQFKILATLPLGRRNNNSHDYLHDPPLTFPGMPSIEEDWVREERMKLKARRNGNGRRGQRKSRRTKRKGPVGRSPSKTRDSPEVIAKKRAERVAKKERLAQEAAEIAAAIGDTGDL